MENLEKVFSMDDICKLINHLYVSEDTYVSAYDNSLVNTTNAYATSTLLTTIQGSFAFKLDSSIYKIKTFNKFIIALCKNGMLYKIDRENPAIQKSKNVLDVIKMNYVYNNFDIYSIVDIEYYSNGVLLATERNGVFYVSLYDNNSSVACQELYISKIRVLPDRKTLLITKFSDKNNVILYNLELGIRNNAYNQMGIINQVAQSICIEEKDFYILGNTSSINQSNKLIHHWKLDDAGIEYENLDKYVAENPCDNSYRPKILKTNISTLCVAGVKDNKLFIWEYDKENLNSKPVELMFKLQDVTYDDLKDLYCIGNKYYITLSSQILVLDEKFALLENYKLDGNKEYNSSKITSSGIYAISDSEMYIFKISEKIYQKLVDVSILSGEICNNLDILVNTGKNNTIVFLDTDTSQQIIPYHYIKMDGKYHIIKLKDITNKNIIMRVSINEEKEKLNGIVIHKNRIFYKNV